MELPMRASFFRFAALGRQFVTAVARRATMRDAAGLGGAWLLAFGVHEIYPPAGLIVGGALLLAGAWLDGRAG